MISLSITMAEKMENLLYKCGKIQAEEQGIIYIYIYRSIREEEANLVVAKIQNNYLNQDHLGWQENVSLRWSSLLLPKLRLHWCLQVFSCRKHNYTELKFQQIKSNEHEKCQLQLSRSLSHSSRLQKKCTKYKML